MTISSVIETFVIAGLVPAVTFVGGALGFAAYYRKSVKNYLQKTEESFQSFAEKTDEEDSVRSLRSWSKQMYKAHTYRNAHGRTVKVTGAGALGWIFAYSTETIDLGTAAFSSSLEIPTPLGLKILAVLAWTAAMYYSLLIIKNSAYGRRKLSPKISKIPLKLINTSYRLCCNPQKVICSRGRAEYRARIYQSLGFETTNDSDVDED